MSALVDGWTVLIEQEEGWIRVGFRRPGVSHRSRIFAAEAEVVEFVRGLLDASSVEDQDGLDWAAAREHLTEVRRRYAEIGAAGILGLRLTIDPLTLRLERGERTPVLHAAIMELE